MNNILLILLQASGINALHWVDWLIIAVFLAVIVGVGVSYASKAGKDITSFFLGGRDLPWLVAGISMVATTFAADTPLAVTELVGASGIAGNWLWWNFLLGGMLTTFFFARLWRRAEVVTEVELIELRYSGKPAAILRGFRSLYLGVFMNVLIIGWVNLAMITLLEVFFNIPATTAFWVTGGILVLVAVYSSISGLLGVAITDNIQFVFAMVGCIILAIIVVSSEQIGGITGMKDQLQTIAPGALNFFPDIGSTSSATEQIGATLSLGIGAFFAYTAIQWWASWYPGAEPGGGGYIVQRMLSAKNEKHAIYSTLFFQIAHYCIRPWPWILIGLCAITLYDLPSRVQDQELQQQIIALKSQEGLSNDIFTKDSVSIVNMAAANPDIQRNIDQIFAVNARIREQAAADPELAKAMQYAEDKKKGYVLTMNDFLPIGLKGLLLAAFFAAFMSTISTQLNWGASYVINDFYKRFIRPDMSDKGLVLASRIFTVILMIAGLIATSFMTSISGVWAFIIECGAGLGLVLILRWYWWRINAWSEIAATAAPFIGYAASRYIFDLTFPNSFFITVGFTTVVWLIVTFLTRPTDEKTLTNFYNKIKPDGAWKPIADKTGKSTDNVRLRNLVICWLSAIVFTYSILFLTGKVILFEWIEALYFFIAAVISFFVFRMFVIKTRIFAE